MNRPFIRTPTRDIHFTINPSSAAHSLESPTTDIALRLLLPRHRQGEAWEVRVTTVAIIKNPVHHSLQQTWLGQPLPTALTMGKTPASSSKALAVMALQVR